jgi:hypothetical protein
MLEESRKHLLELFVNDAESNIYEPLYASHQIYVSNKTVKQKDDRSVSVPGGAIVNI